MFEQCIIGKHVEAISVIRASCNVVGTREWWVWVYFMVSYPVFPLLMFSFWMRQLSRVSGDVFDAGERD